MNITTFMESASEYLGITLTTLNYIAITFIAIFFILFIILIISIFFHNKAEKELLIKGDEKMVFKKKNQSFSSNISEEGGSKTASSEPTLSDFKQPVTPEYVPPPETKIIPNNIVKDERVIINHLLAEITMLKQMLEDKKNELIKRL